jgi:predicted glycosyltransferase
VARFLLYSHDTYGLGHFRRSGLIASGLVADNPDNEVVIVTGSPRAQDFRLPDRVDTIKLPAVTKDADGCYQPRKLGGSIAQLAALRAGLIESAVASYRPDVIVVDHAPLGMGGELRQTLAMVHDLPVRPRLVLGLRDIIDDADHVEATWNREGVWDGLGSYDDIVVYGDPRVLSTASEIDLDGRTAANVTHSGYVAPRMPEAQPGEPYLLVTPGGGGDGHQLLRQFLDATAEGAVAGLRAVVVTGPLLSTGRRAELMERVKHLPGVELLEFSDRMRSLIASATGVISMAGYNTVVEELAAGTPSLLVPRQHPRLEQHIRATRLAPLSNLEHCAVELLDAERISAFAERCLHEQADADAIARPNKRSAAPLELGGVATTVELLTADLTSTPRTTPTTRSLTNA